MRWSRFIFKTHKWLAVAVWLPALMWFFSGVMILIPGKLFGALTVLPGQEPAGPRNSEVAVAVPQAIATIEAAAGDAVEVAAVDFLRIEGRLLYRFRVRDSAAPEFVDAVSGERYAMDENKARHLLGRVTRDAIQPGAALVERHDASYTYGPLPAYRFDVGDSWKTTYFVALESGEIRRTTLTGRIYQFLDGMHTFNFLAPSMGRPAVKIVMLFFAVLGTVMSIFGIAILWVQFVNWKERRRAVL